MGCGGSKSTQTADSSKDTKKGQGKKKSTKDGGQTNRSRDRDDSDDEVDNKKEGKQARLRRELLAATESRDRDRLEKAIRDYDRAKLSNGPELARARRTLVALHEEELEEAIKEQKLERLEAAIEAANNSEVSPELHNPGDTLREAEELRSLLRRLKLYTHSVLELKPMTVSEIHSYKRPRPLVHSVMKATYLLLGEQERVLREWEYIQGLLRRQGRGSIIRRIREFDPRHIKSAKVNRAEDHLKHCNKDKVTQTSAGAGTFYEWSYNIINEGKSNNGNSNQGTPNKGKARGKGNT